MSASPITETFANFPHRGPRRPNPRRARVSSSAMVRAPILASSFAISSCKSSIRILSPSIDISIRRSTNALINARLLRKRNCTHLDLTPIHRDTAIRLWALKTPRYFLGRQDDRLIHRGEALLVQFFQRFDCMGHLGCSVKRAHVRGVINVVPTIAATAVQAQHIELNPCEFAQRTHRPERSPTCGAKSRRQEIKSTQMIITRSRPPPT
jgi:hypothetical protein